VRKLIDRDEFEQWLRRTAPTLLDMMYRENETDTLVGWSKEFAELLVEDATDEGGADGA
jgi:hypothetical protein